MSYGRGRLFVISGPSGVGKGTLVDRLLELRPDLTYSVSATTRRPRPGERDGRDYRFLSDAEFDRLVEAGGFLEWAEVYGHRSGTLLEPVEQARSRGQDVVLEIDVQGARSVRERVADAVLIFLQPPSAEELARRLERRGTEDAPALRRRLEAVEREMEQRSWFDHVVENDDLDRAVSEVASILDAR